MRKGCNLKKRQSDTDNHRGDDDTQITVQGTVLEHGGLKFGKFGDSLESAGIDMFELKRHM